MTQYVFDIGVLILIAICFFIGQKVGFIRSVLNLSKMLVAFILAKICGELLARVLFDSVIRSWFVNRFTQAFSSAFGDLDAMWQQTPGVLRNLLENSGVGANELFSDLSGGASALAERATLAIRALVISLLSFALVLLLFSLFIFILNLLIRLIDKVFELPVLRWINTLLGGLFGALIGVFTVYLICYFWNNISGLLPKDFVLTVERYAKYSHLLALFS